MGTYLDRVMLLVLGFILNNYPFSKDEIVVRALVGVILFGITGCMERMQRRKVELAIYALLLMLGVGFTRMLPFAAMICFSIVYKFISNRKELWIPILLTGGIAYYYGLFYGVKYGCLLWILFILSADLGWKCRHIEETEHELKKNRDDATELTNTLRERNKYLTQNQDKEIHIATLSERNRIAREIHDNVGHILSRSILQLGAIMAIHKEEEVSKQLEPLKETLNAAMNNIRESVHDLHKESFDLKAASDAVLEDLTQCEVDFECDISEEADKEIKYAFVTILKEAVTNVQKHSNATRVKISMCELSESYQMLIADNGTIEKSMHHTHAGIGIENMEERIRNLKGICNISQDNGFRIFISVPKAQEERR